MEIKSWVKYMSKITMIVPVYNGEKVINRCIDSILEQSFKSYSIIIVNDGSTDNTKRKLAKYSTNKRIKIINTKNQGVSAARNLALHYVSSEYVGFIDADDYIESNYLQDLFNGITTNKNIDLSVINFNKKNLEGSLLYQSNYTSGIMDAKRFIEYVLRFDGPGGYLWNKLFRRKIICDNFLHFDTELSIAEDLLFCIEYLKECTTVNIVDRCGYNYIVSQEGITGSGKKKEKKEKFLHNYRLALKKIRNILDKDYLGARLECEARIVQVDGTLLRSEHNKKNKVELRVEIRKYLNSFKKSDIISFKQKIVLICSVYISYI